MGGMRGMEEYFYDRESLPNQGQAFQEFLRSYPLYLDTLVVDHIREQEYPHLNERSQVCLDYMGVGLFSFSQQAANPQAAALGLAYISANLATHALYTAEETEMMVRRRVLRYMNIDENEYAIVFTANKLSAFKLLGESYPFHLSSKLLLGYDHRDESQDALAECAKAKGATVVTGNVTWPSLKLSKADVKKKLLPKTKPVKSKGWGPFHSAPQRQAGMPPGAGNHAGDFSPNNSMPMGTQGMMAYPVMSCGSGAKNSLQFVREASQNGWHVLLDVSGLGAKAMDTLGLNLFHPDFIVGSFYKVFGSDPTGFGCLVIKKSVIRGLGNSSRARAIGMVRIVSTAGTGTGTGIGSGTGTAMGSARSTFSGSSRDSFSSALGNWDWPSDAKSHSGSALLRENEALNAQFDERFTSNTAHLLSQPHGQQSKAGVPVPEICEEIALPEMQSTKDQWHEEDISKQGWVRTHSSHSSFAELEPTQENEIALVLKPSSRTSHRRFFSAEQPRGSAPMRGSSGQNDGPGRPDVAGSRFGRAKEVMTGLRYLQIPKQQGWEDQINVADKDNFLSRDFGKKSPLMLTLPTGFDSPSNRTPPFSKHEVHQEFLMGSLPATPSSVSAPCSPRHLRLHSNAESLGYPPGAIVCRGLDLADEIGLTRINFRLRALINWLISSLRKLRHSTPDRPHVVVIYGPLCQNDRSSTFTFNIAGSDGVLLDPVLVQRLADRNSISLATSMIQGTFCLESEDEEAVPKVSRRQARSKKVGKESKAGGKGHSSPRDVDLARLKWGAKDDAVRTSQFSALCASLCFLTSFTDVYRLLEFAALFLDADFVHRELFHYRALNQQTILM